MKFNFKWERKIIVNFNFFCVFVSMQIYCHKYLSTGKIIGSVCCDSYVCSQWHRKKYFCDNYECIDNQLNIFSPWFWTIAEDTLKISFEIQWLENPSFKIPKPCELTWKNTHRRFSFAEFTPFVLTTSIFFYFQLEHISCFEFQKKNWTKFLNIISRGLIAETTTTYDS